MKFGPLINNLIVLVYLLLKYMNVVIGWLCIDEEYATSNYDTKYGNNASNHNYYGFGCPKRPAEAEEGGGFRDGGCTCGLGDCTGVGDDFGDWTGTGAGAVAGDGAGVGADTVAGEEIGTVALVPLVCFPVNCT